MDTLRALVRRALTGGRVEELDVDTVQEALSLAPLVPMSAGGQRQLTDGSVQTSQLADGAVTAAKLGASAVETAKLNDGAVTAAKLGASAVETAKLNDGAVTAAKLANDARSTVLFAARAEVLGTPLGSFNIQWGQTFYLSLVGAGVPDSSEADVRIRCPRSCVLTGVAVWVSANTVNGNMFVRVWQNGAVTSPLLGVDAGPGSTGNISTSSGNVTVAAGDLLSVRIEMAGSGGGCNVDGVALIGRWT